MADGAIKTARRVFEILEHFEEVRRPLGLKEIVSRFGYPVSSASVILKSMVVLGYLEYNRDSRSYIPTMRMATLGNWVQETLFGDGAVVELMHHMAAATSETITIGTQSDLFAQYIHVVPSVLPIQFVIKPGDVRSLAVSGMGWLLLSSRPDAAIEGLLRRIAREEKDRARRVTLPDLMERIEQIRSDGYMCSRHTVVRGGGVIGMLLPTRPHGRVLAIGVNGPVDRLDEKHDAIVAELRAAIPQYLGPAPG
ncbi:MAG: transcriptional regulator [Comamonadaceae bacterium]|nr:MAG: transcriptional regulator [Comamonadaceae bacterium]